MASTIAKVYYRSLKRGTITYDEVPAELKAEVLAIGTQELNEGKITQADFDRMFNLVQQ